jgi:hypothetical protein
MATRAERLYRDDFYAWTREQAAALRRLADLRWNGPLDLLHLAEEVEDLGSEQQNAVMSQLERIIEHLLKLEHSRDAEPRRQWMIAVNSARRDRASDDADDPEPSRAGTCGPVSALPPQRRTRAPGSGGARCGPNATRRLPL